MEQSPNLALPYIMPSQAQKHVTHNEAIRMLDAVVQLGVLDRDLATPPAEPADGDRYIVATDGAAAWSGRDGQVAAWQDGAWAFLAPRTGWLAWVEDEERLLVWDGAAWQPAFAAANGAATFGINAAADETNRLAIAAPATLFSHQGSDHRLKVNKAAAGDTASLVFQAGYSGRAELGAVGDDDFRLKVSPDGAEWRDAIVVDRATGAVRLPLTPRRELLTADRTYYVRTDGDDGNDGLADSSGGAFETIGRALAVAFGEIDTGPFNVTIQLGDGVYQEQVKVLSPHVGAGRITLAGNSANPENTVIEGTSSFSQAVIWALNGATLYLRDLEIRRASGSLRCVLADMGARVFFEGTGMRLGSAATAHLAATNGGVILVESTSYTVVGDCARHWLAQVGGIISAYAVTVDVGDRDFLTCFAEANRLGIISARGAPSFTGTVTGKRFAVSLNGVVDTNSGNPDLLPGDEAGTEASGGIYG